MTTGIFANPIEIGVNNQVLHSFTARFEGAKEVTWKSADNYIRANFMKDGQSMSAFFNVSGELIGVSKHILSQRLPINLNIELRKL